MERRQVNCLSARAQALVPGKEEAGSSQGLVTHWVRAQGTMWARGAGQMHRTPGGGHSPDFCQGWRHRGRPHPRHTRAHPGRAAPGPKAGVSTCLVLGVHGTRGSSAPHGCVRVPPTLSPAALWSPQRLPQRQLACPKALPIPAVPSTLGSAPALSPTLPLVKPLGSGAHSSQLAMARACAVRASQSTAAPGAFQGPLPPWPRHLTEQVAAGCLWPQGPQDPAPTCPARVPARRVRVMPFSPHRGSRS